MPRPARSIILSSCSDPVTTQYNRANDTVGYAIYAAATRSPATWQYNTLCKLTANDTGLTVTRPVQKYITSDFLYRWGWSTASTSAGDVYIFAIGSMNSNTTHNLYMVQVPFDDIEDTSKVRFNASDQ